MKYATALTNETRKTYTENGATAYNTTGDALVDFFSIGGSLREADETRIERLFEEAKKENTLLALKALFYIRDVRGGLGERRTFRILLKYIANHEPDLIKKNLWLIDEYGRYDDLYELIGTPVEEFMWNYVRSIFEADENYMSVGEPCSLLAKWLKSADASSKKTRKLGIYTALKLGMTVPSYKRRIKALRRYIDVVEAKMSTGKWTDINYEHVPSRASMVYRKAFWKHDPERYSKYVEAATKGEAKIHADTLYPYDLIGKYLGKYWYYNNGMNPEDPTIEALWKALPDYVGTEANALVIADTSGSMSGRPICSALGLAIYFAQRNKGPFHNLWMSFSANSTVHMLRGESLRQQLSSIDMHDWGSNTNLERAFMHVLGIAVNNHVPPEEMVKSLIVVSDMEIDYCTGSWSFYEEMKRRFEIAGYEIPNVVFWNVESRHDVFHADATRPGVQLVSGQAAGTFKQLMASIGKTPYQMMLDVLNSERYSMVSI